MEPQVAPVIVELLDGRGAVVERVHVVALPATIGRAYDSTIVLDDPYVDALHARIVASDGWLAIEDAGSVNGIRATAAGEPGTRVHIASGDTVRIGRSTLRFVDPARPLAPALVDRHRVTPAARWLSHPAVAWSILGATTVLFVVLRITSAIDRTVGADAVSTLVLLFGTLGVWAAGWAAVNRIVAQRFQFLAHFAVAALAAMAVRLFFAGNDLLDFLYPDSGPQPLIVIAGAAIIIAMPIAMHLALISTMSRVRRWRIGFAVSGVAFAVIGLVTVVDKRKFSTALDFPSEIEALPASWIPTVTPDAFFTDTRTLPTKVED